MNPAEVDEQPQVRKRGRPTKRTAEVIGRILRAVRLGQPLERAALYGGISYETLNEWRKDFPDFSASLQTARAEMEIMLLERLEVATQDPKTWTAIAWKLERIFPKEYGKRMIEITPETTPTKQDAENSPPVRRFVFVVPEDSVS